MNNVITTIVAKRIVKRISRRRYHEAFLRRQRTQERKYKKTLIAYLARQEKRVLRALGASKGYITKVDDPVADLHRIWQTETDLLIETSTPHIESSLKSGSVLAANQIGGVEMWDEDITNALFARQNRLVKVSNRLYNQIKMEINEGLALGESLNGIADRIRTYYDTSEADALRIARTETSSAMSAASLETYSKNGVEKKRWLATNDGRTRDTHLMNQDAGAIPLEGSFPGTGESYPGESEINCRCALAAEIV